MIETSCRVNEPGHEEKRRAMETQGARRGWQSGVNEVRVKRNEELAERHC